jgi:hypothetical protein
LDEKGDSNFDEDYLDEKISIQRSSSNPFHFSSTSQCYLYCERSYNFNNPTDYLYGEKWSKEKKSVGLVDVVIKTCGNHPFFCQSLRPTTTIGKLPKIFLKENTEEMCVLDYESCIPLNSKHSLSHCGYYSNFSCTLAIIPFIIPTFPSVFIRFITGKECILSLSLSDEVTGELIENIEELKTVIKNKIQNDDQWKNVYESLYVSEDLKDPSRLTFDNIFIYRPYSDLKQAYVSCGDGEKILLNIINGIKVKELTENKLCPLLLRVSIGHQSLSPFSINIIKDYARGSISEYPSADFEICYENIFNSIKEKDKPTSENQLVLINNCDYEIIKEGFFDYIPDSYEKRTVYLFHVKQKQNINSDNLAKETNVYVINESRGEVFYVQCSTEDTKRMLINKISKKCEMEKSKLIIFLKKKILKKKNNGLDDGDNLDDLDDPNLKNLFYLLDDDDSLVCKDKDIDPDIWNEGLIVRVIEKDHLFQLTIKILPNAIKEWDQDVLKMKVKCGEPCGLLKDRILQKYNLTEIKMSLPENIFFLHMDNEMLLGHLLLFKVPFLYIKIKR